MTKKTKPAFNYNIYILLFSLLLGIQISYAQNKLHADIPVSDSGDTNGIGSANTSRNVAIDTKGNIYVVYGSIEGIRLAKSTNGGQSFLPSILIATTISNDPEININQDDVIYVAWTENATIFFSSSTDEAVNFSNPRAIGSNIAGNVHMSSYGNNVYLIDQLGQKLFSNSNSGIGDFKEIFTGVTMVYADVLADQNGVVFTPMDNPNLLLFKSIDQGETLTGVFLNPPGAVFYSSYALSDGPCGTFIFVGGSDNLGYKINAKTGETQQIILGENTITNEGRTLFADAQGTLIDGYRADDGNLMMSISSDQGNNFNEPILIASGGSHNITRSPVTNNIAVVYEKDGNIFLSVYSDILKGVTISTSNLSFCSSQSFDLSYNLSGVFDANTLFTVSLSDEFGNFENQSQIGSVTSNSDGIINCTLPNNLPQSNLYRIQIESLDNCLQSNNINLSIGTPPIEGPREVCIGETIELSSSEISTNTTPWVSSDTNIAIINSDGILSGISEGVVEITYNTSNNCNNTIEITVFPLPIITENVSLQQCDDDIDGFSNFNLTEVNAKIVSNTADFTFTYFETQVQAENNESPIINFTAYRNEQQNIDTVWARVENNNQCFKTSEIALTVSTTQIPANFINTFFECDSGSDLTDGIATFNFSNVTDKLKSIFPANQPLTIKYYRNEADALSENNVITDITNYQNIGFPNQQDIYVRVDNDLNNDCVGLGAHISLNVEKVPLANSVVIDTECDNDRDGLYSFDTSTIQNTIIGNQTNVSVSYFDENNNTLSSPLPNPFITASKQIRAVVTNTASQDIDGQCTAETLLNFVVSDVPVANAVAIQEKCDDDFDGIIDFDTSLIQSTVIGDQTNLVVKYFDENNNALPSPLPNPFITNSQTIKIRLENPDFDICVEETFVEFRVKEKPSFDLIEEEILCITENPEVEISISNPNKNDNSYVWLDENNNVVSNSSTALITRIGVYSVIATSNEGCASNIKQVLVKESSISTLNINDIEIKDDSDDNNIRIDTSNLGLGVYEFRLLNEDNIIIRDYQVEPFFENLDGGVYTIEIKDINGCGTLPFEVSLLEFPKFFTPNNDNQNDFWQIKGISKNFYESGKINIFNRYGALITTFTIDDLGWDGTYNGKVLSSNDYWFYAELLDRKNVGRVRKGNFSLLRK